MLVEFAYKDLMRGREAFGAIAGQLQEITYVLSLRAQPIPVGVHIITVLPDAPQRGVIELALGASDPKMPSFRSMHLFSIFGAGYPTCLWKLLNGCSLRNESCVRLSRAAAKAAH